MPNSDNTFGTYNKNTIIHAQGSDDDGLTAFASVDAAKSHIYSTEALAVFDECCTNIQWALVANSVNDNTKLKVTYDFGTKGNPDIAPAEDWTEQFNSRKVALVNANNWIKSTTPPIIEIVSSDHLF